MISKALSAQRSAIRTNNGQIQFADIRGRRESKMKNFKDLKVWEKSHRLTLEIYESTAGFPPEEIYGLKSQMRRASVSIPTNIAEGCGRNTDADLARFLEIAMGSASELQYLVLLAKDLEMLDNTIFENLTEMIVESKQMLSSLIKRLRTKS
jgi:four helix bundle protein